MSLNRSLKRSLKRGPSQRGNLVSGKLAIGEEAYLYDVVGPRPGPVDARRAHDSSQSVTFHQEVIPSAGQKRQKHHTQL